MPSAISLLYEPLISRDIAAIRGAVLGFRKSHSATELFEAVARFAILSYSPSQHGKHAVLACLAAHELREDLADHYDQILVECAVYAAQSRLPWSEPPMTEAPAVSRSDPWSDDEIRESILGKDRLRAERWLARRMREPKLEQSFFSAAAEDLSENGHKLIVAVAAWQLAGLLGSAGEFASLRIAPIEWTAYVQPGEPPRPVPQPVESALRLLIDALVEESGGTIAFHRIELLDAALTAEDLSGLPIVCRVKDLLLNELTRQEPVDRAIAAVPRAPVYALARDYAQYLQSHAIARRMQRRFPAVDSTRILSAAKFNLEHGPSFEEWSFA